MFACVSEPPQHGKTETILHGYAHWLEQCPAHPLAYISYNDDIARDKSRKCRDYAGLADVEIRGDSHSARTWTTPQGGGLIARGILGGAITGQAGLKCIVVDDPYKNRAEAESRIMRDRVDGEFRSSIVSRLHPTTSIVVNHTRWHEDDQIGRLLKREPGKWEHHNLPAIENGKALWEEGQPLAHLEGIRDTMGPYGWWSLYMGQPRPRDGKLFNGVSFYDELPGHLRIAIGVDLAYTSKTASDWSVAVVMAERSGRYYVLDVIREQCAAPKFASSLKTLANRYPGAPMMAYVGGTEIGVVDFLRKDGVPLQGEAATSDKFVRAQPLSAAWNPTELREGRVFLPRQASWLEAFTSCLLDFTGLNDPHDDDVDAAAAAFDCLSHGLTGAYVPPRKQESRPTRGRRQGAW